MRGCHPLYVGHVMWPLGREGDANCLRMLCWIVCLEHMVDLVRYLLVDVVDTDWHSACLFLMKLCEVC